MFSTNNSENSSSSIIKVSPDGISRNIKVKEFVFVEDKNRLNVILENQEGATMTLYFRCPDPTWSLKRQSYTMGDYEHLFNALIPEKADGTPKFGATLSFDTFEEWCNHFTSQIDLSKAPAFDIVLLYSKDKAVKENDKIQYPMTVHGSRPFISSPYFKNTLDPKKDIESMYPKFTSYTIIEIEGIGGNTQTPASVFPKSDEPSPAIFGDDTDPFA